MEVKSKLLIWGTGREYDKYLNALRYQEVLGKVEILGITSGDGCYDFVDGYKYYNTIEAIKLGFDYLVIATARETYNEILKTVTEYGISEEKIIKISLFQLPEFDIEKYTRIRNKKVSIISNNCWGGYVSHRLEVPFNSPFVNMAISDDDYLKMLRRFNYYLELEPIFDSWEFHNRLQHHYPRFRLGDIRLECLHYKTKEELLKCWKRRVKRINYENLFVMMYTTSEEVLREFDKLPYQNKVCFVPFHTNIKSGYFIELYNKLDNVPFWEVVTGSARGRYKIYDVLSLLSGENKERSDIM